ncbi:MAG: hypothetical protein D6748_04460 [Calditrichaeota bacterium]|nr:MAG: hypothetical protein D6748_04460 [Calditrichota bacterium]
MKVKSFWIIFLVVGIALFPGCEEDTSPLKHSEGTNLVQNPSFEENGEPSLDSWYVEDSSQITFSMDTPPNGGKWSIFLHAVHYGPMPESPAYYIPLSPGNHVIKFSVYGKYFAIPGSALLIVQQDSIREVASELVITDSVWTEYVTVDTVSLSEGDSLYILLYGGGTEVIDGITYFDLVKLILLDEE